MENVVVTWIIFLGVLIPSLIFAIIFTKKIWLEILKISVIKSPKVFRYLTCGSVDVTEFKMKYLYAESGMEENDDFVISAADIPKSEKLVGFKIVD